MMFYISPSHTELLLLNLLLQWVFDSTFKRGQVSPVQGMVRL